MLVCWEWLSEYVKLAVEHEDLALQFAMSGLNHESTEQVGSDIVIDLEVTSNRGDCLGHIGVAREAAVLLGEPLKIPNPTPDTSTEKAGDFLEVQNDFVAGCPEYTARVIRGVKIGPSPDWLVRRLAAIGINSVNNVVDITNYVMMESGQPLHAFDLAQIRGNKIIVRAANDKEEFLAIDHRTYGLDDAMVVIADAERAVALGGVMGGADSEVSESTTDLLIEAARFTPLSIRRTARKLKLQSPSSYRFERSPDPAGLGWASLRCCDLILQLAGGTLAQGVVADGQDAQEREPIEFRLAQIPRILGIDMSEKNVQSILESLGCRVEAASEGFRVVPPSWRADITREADLIEEVARIHGYETIPEDVAVPIGVASPRPKDIALQRARQTLSSFGIDEAMTPSVVGQELEACESLWSSRKPLSVDTPLLVGSKLLRRSLTPSLLAARYSNQTQAIRNAELYEVATVYLPGEASSDLPAEQCTLGIVTAGDHRRIKGVIEEILEQVIGLECDLAWEQVEHSLLQPGSGLSVASRGQHLGFVGIVSSEVQSKLSLDQPVAAAELNVDALVQLLEPVRTAGAISAFPAIERDLNFIVDESLTWTALSSACRDKAGENLQRIDYVETYRDTKKDGAGKKRVLLSLKFQSLERTLTGEEVDGAMSQIIQACQAQFEAKLLG